VPGWEAAVRLGPDDLTALEDLYASDPGKAFFLASMLDHNPFVGVWEDDRLVAAAGTHVASERYGVAAVGAVITRPSHRGRGLGKAVVAALCHRLVPVYETIGLNVEAANRPALNVYDQLGFRRAFQYEEIEVL
jgi:predicted GNAT family acetyltransferase